MFRLMFMVFGLFLSALLRPDDPPADPQDPQDPPDDPPSEPTAEEIYERYQKGELLTKGRTDEIVQDRLARDRKARESEEEKKRAAAEQKAREENEQYKEAYEKEKEAREKAEAERDQEKEGRASERVQNSLKGALRDAGINAERITPALRIADTSEVSITDDGTVSGVDKVVEAVKKDSPEWFEAKQERPGGSPPSPRPPRRERTAEDEAEAKERARRQTRASF